MKTITETKTITTFETLDEIFAAAKPHQVTGQELLNGRSHVFGEWQEIALSKELRDEIIETIIEQTGGWQGTKAVIRGALRYGRPQHWALGRFLLSKYGENPARLRYCAGQDQSWEMKQLRNYLKK